MPYPISHYVMVFGADGATVYGPFTSPPPVIHSWASTNFPDLEWTLLTPLALAANFAEYGSIPIHHVDPAPNEPAPEQNG